MEPLNKLKRSFRNIRVFLLMQWYAAKEVFAYRISTSFTMVAIAFGPLMNFVFITVIYSVSSGIGGWSYYQLLLLSGVASLISSMAWYFASPWTLVNLMKQGGLDIYLTRPYPPYLSILSLGSIYSASSAFTSIAIISYALANSSISLIPAIEFFVAIAFGLAAFISFLLVLTMILYSLFKSARWTQNLMNVFSEFSTYPLTIYGVMGVFIFSLLVPIGIATYYPVAIIYGKTGTLTFFAIVAFAIVLIAFFRMLFERYLKNYTSAIG